MLDGEGARVIEESGAGFVCMAGDSDGLTQAVVRLAAMEPDARLQMGRKGASYASQEFDRSTIISRLEALLASTQSAKFVAGDTLPQRRG
jgi:glycosyltransferase involved in cell wall biosynthesis